MRTFALQVKHVAASNYALWAAITGDEIPEDWKGGNGPEAVKIAGHGTSTRQHRAT